MRDLNKYIRKIRTFLLLALFTVATGLFGYFTYYNLMKNGQGNSYAYVIVFSVLTIVSLTGAIALVFIFINSDNKAKIKDLELRLKKWTNISYHATQAGDEAFNKLLLVSFYMMRKIK